MNKKILLISIILLLGASCAAKKTVDVKPATQPTAFVPTFTEPAPVIPVATSTKKADDKKAAPAEKTPNPTPTPAPTPNPSTPPGIPQECGGNYDCYDKYYRDLVKNYGLDTTFAMIKQQSGASSYVHSECHALTHIIGQAAVEIYPTVSEAYVHGDQFCASGYYHGVMEGIIYKTGRANLPNELNDICKTIPGRERYNLDYFNCNHGLGHGLMGFTNNELFEALKLCDRLVGDWEESSCYGGVFMENVIADFRNHVTKYLHPDNPMYPCGDVETKYKQPCYLIQSSYALKLSGGDFKKTFETCDKVESEFRATCFQSVGRDASGWSASDVQSTKSRCELGKDYFEQSNCVIGAAKDFVWHFHSAEEGYKLCDALNPDLQDICRSTAKAYYEAF